MAHRPLLLIILLLSTPTWAEPCARSFKLGSDIEVPVSTYNARRPNLILWIPSEHGVVNAEHETAAQLVKLGYEVWLADLFSAHFLPISPSSLNTIPASDIVQLIRAATCDYTTIFIVSSGQGAGLALAGAQQWAQQNPQHPVTGAVLLFPNLHDGDPEAGEAPRYLPVTSHVQLPIAILQGSLSPWFWQLDNLKAQLERGGSTVAVQKLPGLRDRFYFREDALPRERHARQQLATAIDRSIRGLSSLRRRKTP